MLELPDTLLKVQPPAQPNILATGVAAASAHQLLPNVAYVPVHPKDSAAAERRVQMKRSGTLGDASAAAAAARGRVASVAHLKATAASDDAVEKEMAAKQAQDQAMKQLLRSGRRMLEQDQHLLSATNPLGAQSSSVSLGQPLNNKVAPAPATLPQERLPHPQLSSSLPASSSPLTGDGFEAPLLSHAADNGSLVPYSSASMSAAGLRGQPLSPRSLSDVGSDDSPITLAVDGSARTATTSGRLGWSPTAAAAQRVDDVAIVNNPPSSAVQRMLPSIALSDDGVTARRESLGAASAIAVDRSPGGQAVGSGYGGDLASTPRFHEVKIMSQRATGMSREQYIKYLEAFVARQCASTRSIETRADGYCAALEAACDMHPSLVNILSTMKHFLRDMVRTIHHDRREHAEAIVRMKKEIHAQQQEFYEQKFVKNLAEKSQWQVKCKILSDECDTLRKSRDQELVETKTAVANAVKKIEEDEEEIKHTRSLVATVFEVAKEREERIQVLESILAQHHIRVPSMRKEDGSRQKKMKKQKPLRAGATEGGGRHVPKEDSEEADDSDHGDNEDDENVHVTGAAIDERGPAAGSGGPSNGSKGTPVRPPLPPLTLSDDAPASQQRSSSRHPQPPSAAAVGGGGAGASNFATPTKSTGGASAMRGASSTTVGAAAAAASVRAKLEEQVGLEFVEASRLEMERCRLSTQKVLVSCASDSQSTFKLLVSQLKTENESLRHELSALRQAKLTLERFIHEKRFVHRIYQDAERDTNALVAATDAEQQLSGRGNGDKDSNVSDANGGKESTNKKTRAALLLNRDGSNARKPPITELPTLNLSLIPREAAPADYNREELTPRPALPFDIQSRLGIDLRQSSQRIMEELSHVALNFSQSSEELHVRVRRLAASVGWMDAWSASKIEEHEDPMFLPVASTSDWDIIPHFLRTPVQPHVANLKWTPYFTASLVLKFFSQYRACKEAARWERDLKMLAPRVHQPFERAFHAQIVFDATADAMKQSVEAVPTGYIVSQFLITELLGDAHLPESKAQDMLQSRVVVPKLRHRVVDVPVEVELAKSAYNLWYAARKYRACEPLCALFVLVIEGRVPLESFDALKSTHDYVCRRFSQIDFSRSGMVTYQQLTGVVASILTDQDAEVVRAAVFSVVQTLEAKNVSLIGKISLSDVLSDEARVQIVPKRRATATTGGGGAAAAQDSEGALGSGAAAATSSAPPAALQAQLSMAALPIVSTPPLAGATIMVKFFRRLALNKLDAVYRNMEALCYPNVRESKAVKGMMLLKLTDCRAVLEAEDANPDRRVSMVTTRQLRTVGGDSYGGHVPASFHSTTPSVPPALQTGSPHASTSSVQGGAGAELGTSMSLAKSQSVSLPPGTSASGLFTPAPADPATPQDFTMPLVVNGSFPGGSALPNSTNVLAPPEPRSPLAAAAAALDERPPFLHMSSVPICLGETAYPLALLAKPGSYRYNFDTVVLKLQKYSTSVHFPLATVPQAESSPSAGVGAAASATSGGQPDGKSRTPRKRSLKKQNSSLAALNVDDSNWVEWYQFLATLRQTPLSLTDEFLDGWNRTAVATPGYSELGKMSNADKQATLPPIANLST